MTMMDAQRPGADEESVSKIAQKQSELSHTFNEQATYAPLLKNARTLLASDEAVYQMDEFSDVRTQFDGVITHFDNIQTALATLQNPALLDIFAQPEVIAQQLESMQKQQADVQEKINMALSMIQQLRAISEKKNRELEKTVQIDQIADPQGGGQEVANRQKKLAVESHLDTLKNIYSALLTQN